MANRYTKTYIKTLISDNSNYSSPNCRSTFAADTNIVTEGLAYTVNAVVGGTAIAIANFTTINEAIFHNLDSAITVEIEFTTLAGQAELTPESAYKMDIKPGQQICLVDLDPLNALTLTSASGTAAVEMFIWGD